MTIRITRKSRGPSFAMTVYDSSQILMVQLKNDAELLALRWSTYVAKAVEAAGECRLQMRTVISHRTLAEQIILADRADSARVPSRRSRVSVMSKRCKIESSVVERLSRNPRCAPIWVCNPRGPANRAMMILRSSNLPLPPHPTRWSPASYWFQRPVLTGIRAQVSLRFRCCQLLIAGQTSPHMLDSQVRCC